MNDRVKKAVDRAYQDIGEIERGAVDFREIADIEPTRCFAIGDPQGPIENFFQILDRYDVLGDDGRLAPDTHLYSVGDHFDWGPRSVREKATEDGLAILSWLASHEQDRATIILGNHDLARVAELADLSDDEYLKLREKADAAYDDPKLERKFLAENPGLPSAEMISRDYSCFRTAQRELVKELLKKRRMRAAEALSPWTVLLHAGVTVDDLAAIGVGEGDAFKVAAALNDHLDRCVDDWKSGPLEIGPLFRLSDNSTEARGIFHHRPGDPSKEDPKLYEGPPRRRFDPRKLPLGLTQIIGHIRDGKCRKLMPDWIDPKEQEKDGPIRQLQTDGVQVSYGRGLSAVDRGKASIIFIDGGMREAKPGDYELLVCHAIVGHEE